LASIFGGVGGEKRFRNGRAGRGDEKKKRVLLGKKKWMIWALKQPCPYQTGRGAGQPVTKRKKRLPKKKKKYNWQISQFLRGEGLSTLGEVPQEGKAEKRSKERRIIWGKGKKTISVMAWAGWAAGVLERGRGTAKKIPNKTKQKNKPKKKKKLPPKKKKPAKKHKKKKKKKKKLKRKKKKNKKKKKPHSTKKKNPNQSSKRGGRRP